MEAIAWAIVFTVCVFDYRSEDTGKATAFTATIAGVAVGVLFLLTASSWLT